MNTLLRTLEDWTSYQDYAWFLAALAWLTVAFGARGRTPTQTATTGDQSWLEVFAISAITGAVLELVLCAQNLQVPYTKFDFGLGFTQAVSVAALSWPALERHWSVRTVRLVTLVGAGLLAAARVPWPGPAGVALAIAGAAAAWTTARVILAIPAVQRWEPREHRGMRVGLGLAGLLPALATHGPLALMIGEPRILVDFSHLALVASGLLAASGAAVALALWRWRLRSFHSGADFNRGLALLALWLVAGLVFVVWSGRQARRDFEDGMLRRAKTGAALLDPERLRAALGAELQVASFRLRHDPDGKTVEMARIPHGRNPAFDELRRNLSQLGRANPDLASVFIEVLRDGRLIVPVTRKLKPNDPEECVVYRQATATDVEHLQARSDFLEGPVINDWGAHFYAKAALLDPVTSEALGWLVLDASSTRWTLSFTQARLQAMALVGLGAGLWGLAIAYRLRRAEGVAAAERAAAAAEADRMKSTFLAKVSHELRTPIQSVIGYCDLLARAPLEPEHRGWLTALRTHSDMMLRLVNDLLDLGAMQTGAFRLRPAEVELLTHARGCIDALRPQADAKGLRLEFEFAPDTPTAVETDPVRLRQILLNLLVNAVKFTARGGVRLAVRRPADEFEFVVSDTGPGIPAARRAQLFQPFVRLEGSVATEGTGLGLALVSGLCTVMGGRITHADNPDGGSTFIVQLPLRLAAHSRDAEATPANLAYDGLRVLIAEDNTLVREWLATLMKKSGAVVEAVADGAAAVAACRSRLPDVVILDLSMPLLDGLGASREIRRIPVRGDVRPWIIGLSAHAQAEDEAAALAAGMDRFLVKPVSETTLDEHLRAAPAFRARQRTARQAAGVDELRTRLLAQYQAETPALIADLRQAMRSADWPRVVRQTHYLTNSADVLAADELQQACRALHAWALRPDDRALGDTLLAAVEAAARTPLSTTSVAKLTAAGAVSSPIVSAQRTVP